MASVLMWNTIRSSGRFEWSTMESVMKEEKVCCEKFQLKEVKCLWTLEQLLLLFRHSVVSCSLQTRRLQLAGPFTISWSLLKLIHNELMMPSNHLTHFSSYPESFPASGSFPISQLFTLSGQSMGASASASILPWKFRVNFL